MAETIRLAEWSKKLEALSQEALSNSDAPLGDMIVKLESQLQGLRDEALVRRAEGSLSRAVLAAFASNRWRANVAELLKSSGVDDLALRVQLEDYTEAHLIKIRSLAELMNEEADEEDLRKHLVFWFVEAKSEWYQLNSIVNYQIARGATPDNLILFQGSAGSAIIAELEKVFERHDIEVLTDYLFEPLPTAKALNEARLSA